MNDTRSQQTRASAPSAAGPDARPKIAVEGLSKEFATAQGGRLEVLKELDLAVADEEFVSIIGPSGCGKTTLLSIIAGLIPPTAGRILVDDVEVKGPGRERGVVFQQDAILPWRTVRANVAYGLEIRGLPRDEVTRIVDQHLEIVDLQNFDSFYPKELSGGMKKRVGLAAVFANDPAVLLMDEPFGSLDYPSKLEMQKVLLDTWEREKKTTVFITHDLEEAIFLSDRIFAMADGGIARIVDVPFGRPREELLRVSPEFQVLKSDLWEYLK